MIAVVVERYRNLTSPTQNQRGPSEGVQRCVLRAQGFNSDFPERLSLLLIGAQCILFQADVLSKVSDQASSMLYRLR